MSLSLELSEKRLKYKVSHRELILDRFCEIQSSKKDITRKYFSQLWEGYTWAAIMGFLYDKRSPIKGGKTDTSFKFSVIYNNGSDIADALVLMAIAKSVHKYKALTMPEEIITIIEEYANGGFEVIESILKKNDRHFDNPDSFIEELLERNKQDYQK